MSPALLGLAAAKTSSGSSLWYFNRATGVVSLVLLSLVVVLGILVRSRREVAGAPRFVAAAVHRNASLLTLAFLAVHIMTAVLDPYVVLNVSDAVVPFGSAYRTLWVGLGAVSLDLLLAVTVTSLLRSRIGVRRWRAVHWAVYAAWPVAVLHGIGTGSDVGRPWMLALTAVCVAAVLGSVARRFSPGFAPVDQAGGSTTPKPPTASLSSTWPGASRSAMRAALSSSSSARRSL